MYFIAVRNHHRCTVAHALIDGSLAAPGLLTWVATCKYLDHFPLYRLEQIAARQQVKAP